MECHYLVVRDSLYPRVGYGSLIGITAARLKWTSRHVRPRSFTDIVIVGDAFAKPMLAALDAARQRGIAVTNVPAYSTASVAQHVFALLLELVRGVGRHNDRVRQGAWSSCPDFAFQETPQIELAGNLTGAPPVRGLPLDRSTRRLAASRSLP